MRTHATIYYENLQENYHGLMSFKLTLCDQPTLKAYAARQLTHLLDTYPTQPILLMLSGGSSVGLLQFVDPAALNNNTTISVLDERWSREPNVNNYLLMTQTDFYHASLKQGARWIETIPQSNETPEQCAARFEKNIRKWKHDHVDGVVIITLGIGPDGHTSGILPNDNPAVFRNLFDTNDLWVRGYDAGKEKNQYPKRITVTFPFLRQVDHAISYVSGENKQRALQKTLAARGEDIHLTPARIVHEMKDVEITTDIVL
jgi:6-phosphogluconolactonase/glucosamine-6-phosphate isomerase/deaminase